MKKSVSERLKEFMQITGLRQVDVLERCKNTNLDIKITRGMLSQYIMGSFVPKQDKIMLLSAALNVSESWLLGFDVPMERIIIEENKQDIVYNTFDKEDYLILEKINKLNDQKKNRVLGYIDMLLMQQDEEDKTSDNKEVIKIAKSVS